MPFPKDISLKVNIIVQFEFELVYFEAAVQHFSHYTTGISLAIIDDLYTKVDCLWHNKLLNKSSLETFTICLIYVINIHQ